MAQAATAGRGAPSPSICRTTAASAALFIHKTTLFYRLEQMEKLVGPFLKDSKLLFLYEYSLMLMEQLPSGVLTKKIV